MSDSASDPEEEKPRYLLPEGCKDLIDAFPKEKPPGEIMFEPDSIPNGLSVLPGYISRLVMSLNPSAWLSVFTADELLGFGVTRWDNKLVILLSTFDPGESELECRVRALFARHSSENVEDYLSTGDTVRHLVYALPKSADAITDICRELLTDCFKVQPNATLLFALE
jgi:hypothetical protein